MTNTVTEPLVSVIVPTKNREVQVAALLESLAKSTYPNLEVLINDDVGADATTQQFVEGFVGVKVRYFRTNRSRAQGRLDAAKRAEGSILLHLDSDMTVSPGLVAECVALLGAGYDALVIPEVSHGQGFWARCKVLEKAIYRGVEALESARCLPRALYEEVGGHDPQLVFSEDKDLDLRLRASGIKVGRTDRVIYHDEGRVSLTQLLHKRWQTTQGAERFAEKHPEHFRQQRNVFNRYGLFFKKAHLGVRAPLHYAGLLYFKTLEYGVAFARLLAERYRKHPNPSRVRVNGSPHVVMVSWKGPRHPKRGGAELYALNVLAGLSAAGCRTTWLVPEVAGLPQNETTQGIQVRRRGGRATHLLHAWRYLQRHPYTVVIDQANAYPMLTPLFVKRDKGLLLIYHLTKEVWFYEMPYPVAVLGYFVEPLLLRPYHRWATVTLSSSTAADLHDLGFKNVTVTQNALPLPSPVREKRTPPETPHFVGLGRLVRMKRFEHLLDAFSKVRRTLPDARLTLIGRGDTAYARRLAARVDATPGAQLLNGASDAQKHAHLANATAVVAPSVREGWGLMVSEGHAFGTPSIAYRVPGLQDSTLHEVDGLLTRDTPSDLATAMLRVSQDKELWQALSHGAFESAARRSAVRQVDTFYALIAERFLGQP